jgi:hypothetical protein
MGFSQELKKEKKRLALKHAELCEFLHGVPLRTLQSWLRGEKLPPLYYQKLILEKLSRDEKVRP